MSESFEEQASRISTEILGPNASAVDQTGEIPAAHLDALAAAGLYGTVLNAPPASFPRVVESLAEGCLSTAFVWLQHHSLVGRLADPSRGTNLPTTLRDDLLTGETRAGIVQAGLLPGDPLLTATPSGDGSWRLDGFSPWCTGWGMVNELLVAARVKGAPECVGLLKSVGLWDGFVARRERAGEENGRQREGDARERCGHAGGCSGAEPVGVPTSTPA